MERQEAEFWKERGRGALYAISQRPYSKERHLDQIYLTIREESGRFATFDEAITAWCDLVEELYLQANGEGFQNRRAAEMKIEGVALALEALELFVFAQK